MQHPTAIFADPQLDLFIKYRNGVSIVHGWFPWAVQILAVLALAYALSGRHRTKRWWLLWLPVVALLGSAVAAWSYWWVYFDQGAANDPLPEAIWFWAGGAAAALTAAVLSWRGQQWVRRAVAVTAVFLCLLSTAVVTDQGVGYYDTLQEAWADLTSGPLPDEISPKELSALQGTVQTEGKVVPIDIPDTVSGFNHRTEYVYLPPAWFASKTPPQLPVVMMIGGAFQNASNWFRMGNATTVADQWAAQHDGFAPILVGVDSGGTFNNDTECVNGPHGNAADHLVKEVPPYVVKTFGASADPAGWGVAGFSSGGTCSVDLAVMHPELFSAFVDIGGDAYPYSGTKEQTIERLFGGNATAFAAFDPAEVMAKHGPYQRTAGWFEAGDKMNHKPGAGSGLTTQDHLTVAAELCDDAKQVGIQCAVVSRPGLHTWIYAAAAFQDAFGWLVGYLHTPRAPQVPLGNPVS